MHPAIKVLIIEGVFIMPNPSGWVRHFVANESKAIDRWSGLDPVESRARVRPSPDGRLRSDRGSDG